MKLCMCDCCAEEGQPPGREETRQRLSFKSRRLHRGLLRADPSAMTTQPSMLRFRRRVRRDIEHRPRQLRFRQDASVKVKPPGGGSLGGFCLEIRRLGRIGVSGDWGYAGVRVEQ